MRARVNVYAMSDVTPADLPGTVEDLRAFLRVQNSEHAAEKARLEQTVVEYRAENARLAEYIRLLKSQRFGRSSERTQPNQPALFNEAEVVCDRAKEAEPEIEIPGHRRRRGGRKPIPESVPRVEVLRDLEAHQKVCPNHPDHALRRMGEERAERLVYRPAELYVEVEVRPKYACGTCKDAVACQPPSPQPIPKSLASASLLSQIATAKYVDGLPLARQEKIFARLGLDLPRATLAAWMIRCAELVQPLTDLLLERVRAGQYVLADETPFQVLKEAGRRAESTSYLWALRLEDPEAPVLYYEYAPTRSGEVARTLLQGFTGFLQTDGYVGYDSFEDVEGVVHVGCFAHARRKFDAALRGQGKSSKTRPKSRIADQGLKRINKLFEIERRYRDETVSERHRLRQEHLAPRPKELNEWMVMVQSRVPPKSLTGKAIDYLESQWSKLVRVLEHGRLELSTNSVERSIRPFVIGRKAWLFADTPRGATASARLYSLVETAKANQLEPWRYLQTIFERLPLAQERADYEALLPWHRPEPPETPPTVRHP
jgi:transposase